MSIEGEIKIETANAVPVPAVREWFIAVADYSGDGSWWNTQVFPTALEAENQLRINTDIKFGRIVRVLLPCKAVP